MAETLRWYRIHITDTETGAHIGWLELDGAPRESADAQALRLNETVESLTYTVEPIPEYRR